ncbi:MAG: GMC family oxidoreductase, partial [Gallionella sp.]|nr:GMC family oxidoreductase [Gallionella sp.]
MAHYPKGSAESNRKTKNMLIEDAKVNHRSRTSFADELWDVAVIGTGMGGATVGYELAKAGHRVIFLEKGHADFTNADDSLFDNEDPSARVRNGNWPTKITGVVGEARSQFFAPLGCGAGGTTLLYAAALERFDPSDFAFSSGTDHTMAGWPISFDQLLPYYRKAEKMFKVCGTSDPLCPDEGADLLVPPRLTECDQHFFESFRSSGLHPYRLHVAYGYESGCKECGGYICPRKCKGDAKTICLEPALKTGNAHIIDRCEVERLEADASEIKEITGYRGGEKISIRARIVVLAAGAYFTPVLLLKSTNKFWPNGLANTSDMVGRNLMFHVSDFIAVWPRGKFSIQGPRKTLAFRDFTVHRGIKLGLVQSTGLTAGYGNIVYFLKTAFDRSRWSWFKPARPLLRIPAYIASLIFGRATIFATIMEDKPYRENRIVLDPNEPSGMRFEYVVHAELRERISLLRGLIKKSLARHRLLILSQDVSLNYGHPSGTCRFGADPYTSVLDANNKAHG